MQYRLRTLLIVLAIVPPLIVVVGSAIVAQWAALNGTPTGTDPAVQRLINDAKTAPPWDANSFEGKLTQVELHEYELMSDEQQREYRRQKGF